MYKLLLSLITCLSLLAPAFADESPDDVDDNSGSKKQIYHITNDVTLIPTVKIQYGKPRIVVKAVYPLIEAPTNDENIVVFNHTVKSIITEEVNRFTKEVEDNQSVQEHLEKSNIKNDLNIDFSTSIVNTSKQPIVSIRFTIQTYIAGMAHPSHYHRVLNFDLSNGEQLTLANLFKSDSNFLTVLSEYSKEALAKRLKDKDLIEDGTTPTAENFKNWSINPRGLLFTFDEGQVAPYAYGTQSIVVPYAVIKDLLAPKSTISNCVSHPKRCLQNNLLTGGFIDEATNNPSTNIGYQFAHPVSRKA